MKIELVSPGGELFVVDAKEGESVMHAAVSADVPGIIGECGGAMMCATCHCYVDEEWAERAGDRKDGESDLLDCAASPVTETSRLSCQIKMSPALDGIRLRIPDSQL